MRKVLFGFCLGLVTWNLVNFLILVSSKHGIESGPNSFMMDRAIANSFK